MQDLSPVLEEPDAAAAAAAAAALPAAEAAAAVPPARRYPKAHHVAWKARLRIMHSFCTRNDLHASIDV